ncbi:MAG: type II toxin-antitoxin system prevent-host-death family antitoxin [Rhodoblastus sp.]
MPVTFKIAEAKAHFSELVARAEAGEEVIIARGDRAVARLAPLDEQTARNALVETIRAERKRYGRISQDELREWKHEGHKY